MNNLIENNPEKAWKVFKRLSAIILLIGIIYFVLINLITFDSNNLAMKPIPGLLVTNLPEVFIEGETDIITITAYSINSNTINRELLNNNEIDSIPLGSTISVEIIDLSLNENENFEILRIGRKVQSIDDALRPIWEFKMTPLKAGELKIGIKPIIEITNSNTNEVETYDLKMIIKNVKVEARYGYRIKTFMSSNWQWLMTTLIIPLWLYFRIKILNAIKKKNQIK